MLCDTHDTSILIVDIYATVMGYDSCMGCGTVAVCRIDKNGLDQAARAMKISIKTDSARVRSGSHSCQF